ncbi:hypothetical protein ACH5RR_015309 [Cinchona calisaya]|uniref:B-block binding subunit of TFIIIC n=1 Tax=Cinchona calisaya TaxID=153742 RepID=A0ABD2ZVW5_9GENT
MDSVVYLAIEEICLRGGDGLSLQNLWPKLHQSISGDVLPLCPNVKTALWSNLRSIPGLLFEAEGGVSYEPQDSLIRSPEKCEEMKLKIIASEQLHRNFLGIYDYDITKLQRRTLERLAIARTKGILQCELAKEFGVKGKDFFYPVKGLESLGLIVRQPAVLKKKESCYGGEPKRSSPTNSNMLYLYRYAKHLGCQQKLEVIESDKPFSEGDIADVSAAHDGGFSQEFVQEDVHVKDYLPALKAVCDKLEQADGKVLVESDIRRELGYKRRPKYRAWGNIRQKLIDARVVEECCTKANAEKCLRLLKKFSPKHFERKSSTEECDGLDAEQQTGKRGHITDQFMELPIEHQIYDMIDAEGSKGLLFPELCKRLGLRNKQYYDCLRKMCLRFGMHLQGKSYGRGIAHWFWTSGNFNPEASNIIPCSIETVAQENTEFNFTPTIQEVDASTAKDVVKLVDGTLIEPEVSLNTSQSSASDASGRVPDSEQQIVNTTASNGAEHEISPLSVSMPSRCRSYQRHPYLTLGAARALREQRILKILEEEKFLIRPELHRRLVNLEKEQNTMMDGKTLLQSLNKLQKEGLCKCIHVGIPAISNCDRNRTVDVVLHPSISNLSPELLGQIHERLRSFDIKSRRQCSSRMKKGVSVPVLDSVERIPISVQLETQATKAEARRANGYVLAKMVRTKLLHIFLWSYLSSSPGWEDLLSIEKNGRKMKNHHSTSKLFGLDAAIKAMPLELFLQVVGSTQKFEDLIDKCRNNIRLSDLPVQEYRCLMDTRAAACLSRLIDILRRLKLIRLVKAGNASDENGVQDTTLAHALELKPYIEEPAPIVASSFGFIFPDLRPHIRHDFVLSSRKAVDEYWNTLEYCYAASNSKAALYAFPGSAVHEIFFSRSWASAQFMTADQRTELLKRVLNDEPHKKLSFIECLKIAKDLNLTLEQVLHVDRDKRQQHFTRLPGDSFTKDEFEPLKSTSGSSCKRKRSLEANSSKHVNCETKGGYLRKQRLAQKLITNDQLTKRQNSFLNSLGDHESDSPQDLIDDRMQGAEEIELNEEDERDQFFIHKCSQLRRKPGRQRKFSWTEDADRQLVVEYVRHRAFLGAKFHHTDWGSLSNLPAPPETCRRRMALLKKTLQFREAVMRLCNVLSERYAKYLEKFQNNLSSSLDERILVREPMIKGDCSQNPFDSFAHNDELQHDKCWDNFDDSNIKMALDDVLRYKRTSKLNSSKGFHSDEWSYGQDPNDTEKVPSTPLSRDGGICGGISKLCAPRSRSHGIAQKYKKLLNGGTSMSRRVYESVAVSNALELFKLIFLSTSLAPQASKLLAETLRHYSQHDLLASFSYLREKKILIGGNGTSLFALSHQFLDSISLSPFPKNTGKRASKFASWLDKQEKDLMVEEIHLPAELQCGDIFYLCALVSLGELSITPCLPEDGIGKAEDFRTSKRKNDGIQFCGGDKSKRLRTSMAAEAEGRKEKGFPGIRLSVNRVTVPRMRTLEFFKDNNSNVDLVFCENDQYSFNGLQIGNFSSRSEECNSRKEKRDYWGFNNTAAASYKSPWEAMTSYAEHLNSSFSSEESSPYHPELFRTICADILKSGDQGMGMKEIAEVLNISGQKESEVVIDVLEAFGRALKVNAYDSIRVVDYIYRSKYFLTSIAEAGQNPHQTTPSLDCKGKLDDEHKLSNVANHDNDVSGSQKEISMDTDDHRITILNHANELFEPSSETQSSIEVEDHSHYELFSATENPRGETFKLRSCDPFLYRPILPWMNGDGTINKLVYKGLTRRILGIVMQNPGISEDVIIKQMRALNPQSCKILLEKLVLDNHIMVRRMHQTSANPPSILGSLFGSCVKTSKLVFREHFFANPMSTTLL